MEMGSGTGEIYSSSPWEGAVIMTTCHLLLPGIEAVAAMARCHSPPIGKAKGGGGKIIIPHFLLLGR